MAADFTFAYEDLAVGGGIFTAENMKEIAEAGITHIIDCQAEFDDTPLAIEHGIEVLWCPVWDDFTEPDVEHLARAAEFVEKVLLNSTVKNKLLIHCAGGVHRGPMFALLAAMVCGINPEDAIRQIEATRLIARFPKTYRGAVERFVEKRGKRK
jgi:protein-tyrosine phosphatase